VTDEAVRAGTRRLFAEVSVTARPFFERHGFAVLAEQEVAVREVRLTNYRIERPLEPAPG
jgi:putative acetyltransferase